MNEDIRTTIRAADLLALHNTAREIFVLLNAPRTTPEVPPVDAMHAARQLTAMLIVRLLRMDRGPLHWPATIEPPAAG